MPIVVRNVRLGLDEPENELLPAVARRLRVPPSAIRTYAILRRSLDARKKNDIHFRYHIELVLDEPGKAQKARLTRLARAQAVWVDPRPADVPSFGAHPLPERPVVIGFGPGGMLAALRLAELGYRPLVLERGRDVARRTCDIVDRFYRCGDFDPSSNLLFGEGGAGAYSDGKLYTRIHDPLCQYVLESFYHHGADASILVDARPHIGSDCLPGICTSIRRRIEALGGEVRFECQVDDVKIVDERLAEVHVSGGAQAPAGGEWLPAGPTILAIGHSARDTIRMLHGHGVQMEAKPFQIGVRIEHPQEMVDRWQYGAAAGHRRLGPAEYHAVARHAAGDLGDVFSFCMCPGGTILPAVESPGLIATNGASRAARSGTLANSGLVMTLDPAATGLDPLEGLAYQERWERLAFETTGGSYRVPVQRASDLVARRPSDGRLEISYPLGGQWADIAALLPDVAAEALLRAFPMLDAKFPGFAGPEAMVTGPETRVSSAVRIARDAETRQARGVANLYPVGEGAGYAGGIISAAVDGIRTADAIISHYAPPR